MKFKSKAALFCTLLILVISTVACEKEGGAQKAGKEIDKAFNTAKDKIHDATR